MYTFRINSSMLHYWLKRYVSFHALEPSHQTNFSSFEHIQKYLHQCINTVTRVLSFNKRHMTSECVILLLFPLAYFCKPGKSNHFSYIY